MLGWGGGWFGGVGGVSFPFCVCHLSDNSSSPMAFSRSSYLYGTSNKDPRLRLGLTTLGLALLTASPWHQLPPASIAALGRGLSSLWKLVEEASGVGVLSSSGWRGRGLLGEKAAEEFGRAPQAWGGGAVNRDHLRPSEAAQAQRGGGGRVGWL